MKTKYSKPTLNTHDIEAANLISTSKTIVVFDDEDEYTATSDFEALVNNYRQNDIWNNE